MGMAASQARFLGLTARKNNVEFEGQQINQQRTMLSNQSANYYNDLLGMTVPTPPSVDNYTKTVYSFEDGALNNTVTSLIAQANGLYTVSYLSKWQDDYSAISAATSIVTRTGNDTTGFNYAIGAADLRALGSADESITDATKQAARQREEKAWANMLELKYGKSDWCVRYVTDSSTGAEVPYFYSKADLEKATYDAQTGSSLSNINCYTIGSEQKIEEHRAIENCKVEKDSSGRFITLSIPEEVDGKVIYTDFALTTETTTDQDAYNDAMNEYEYQKQLYDQSVEKINSKIEIIQSEDKNLELRLKQLDTEQDAISTEVDAVSKVIEKNTESSFKTFG